MVESVRLKLKAAAAPATVLSSAGRGMRLPLMTTSLRLNPMSTRPG